MTLFRKDLVLVVGREAPQLSPRESLLGLRSTAHIRKLGLLFGTNIAHDRTEPVCLLDATHKVERFASLQTSHPGFKVFLKNQDSGRV